MNTKRLLVSALLASAGFAVCATVAHAQYKPLPPAQPQAVPGSDRLNTNQGFIDAYVRSGSPRLLFTYSGMGSTQVRMAQTLAERLEDQFRDPTISVVNAGARTMIDAKQRESLRRNDEYAAARIAASDSSADVVVTVDIEDNTLPGATSRTMASYSVVNLRTATTIDRWSFELTPDQQSGSIDALRLQEYSKAISSRIAREWERAFAAGSGGGAFTRYELRLVGDYQEDDLVALRDALNTTQGVRQGSAVLRGESTSAATKLTTFEVLASMDALSMRQALRLAASEQLGMTAQVLETAGNRIDVRLTPLSLSGRELALSGGPQTSRNAAERSRLTAAYTKANRPTIAVVISRVAAAEVENPNLSSETLTVGDTTNVVVADRVGSVGGAPVQIDPITREVVRDALKENRQARADQREIDSVQIEGRIIERMTNLGLTIKDIAGAPAATDTPAAGSVVGERSYAMQMAKAVGADVILTGISRVTRLAGVPTAEGAALRVEVTMRAIRVSDGTILAASSASRDVASALATQEQAVDDLASQLVGRLATSLTDTWER